MGKRVVIALGGNALGNNLPEQMIAVKQTERGQGMYFSGSERVSSAMAF